MATKKISELTALTTPVGTEQLVVEEAGGTSKKITAEDLFAGDNVKAKFGDSDDLQIYHDGSNSYVKDAGTGNLRIQAGNLQLTRADGTQNYLTANTGSEVALYHAGSNKLATSSSGVDITGTVRGAVVAYSANQNAPYLIAGTAGYTGATTNWNTYGIQHRIKTNSGGTPRVTIDNYTGEQWSLNASGGMVLTPTGTDGHAIFNEDGINVDFRVESNNNSHMLFVDGGTNHVGIGTSSPQHALSIKHSDKADPQIHLETASYGSAYGVKILAASTNESGTVSSFNGLYKTTASVNTRLDVQQHISYVSNAATSDYQYWSAGGSEQLRISGGGSVSVAGNFYTNGNLRLGSSAASTNVELNLNGVASKAQRIQFQESGVNKWLLGQGAASETSAFELYNSSGVITLSVDRTSNIATFQRGAVFNEGGEDSDFRVESDSKSNMLFVDAGNDAVNFNSTQTTHQLGAGYRTDGLLRDFQRDVATATFNESSNVNTPSRTRRLIIPLYNYGPVKITIMNGGHLYNNGGSFGFRETTFYVAMESTSLRVNTKVDGVNAGNYASSYGVPTAAAHSSLPELKIEWTVAAQMTCSTHVKVEGYGANGITSIETL